MTGVQTCALPIYWDLKETMEKGVRQITRKNFEEFDVVVAIGVIYNLQENCLIRDRELKLYGIYQEDLEESDIYLKNESRIFGQFENVKKEFGKFLNEVKKYLNFKVVSFEGRGEEINLESWSRIGVMFDLTDSAFGWE